ncbi:MAG: DUF4037 domain-containing protein [Chloroflexi bacterium]|nr:DUF4037 domain-containing protein [Chloroflexota bacterium]
MKVVENGAITTAEVPFRPYTIAGMIQKGRVLHDPDGLMDHWKKLVARYPLALRRNILARFLPVLRNHTEDLVAHAERGLGPAGYLYHLDRAVDAMHSIMFAINEVYDPADRRADTDVIPTLTRVPSDFLVRYRYVLGGPFAGADGVQRAVEWRRLADEVRALAA